MPLSAKMDTGRVDLWVGLGQVGSGQVTKFAKNLRNF